jgi:hypothetical protein
MDVLDIDASDAQPALMATLWLLGEFLRHGYTGLPVKVRDNLAALSSHPSLTEESRRHCQRLCAIWERHLERPAQGAPALASSTPQAPWM